MRTKILLTIILLVAAVIRFVALDKIPVSPYWDEVAIGYNAYSIAHTGRDEYGRWFPLLFQSYNDYKMPGQIYLSVIPIAIFGLNIFSTRFISAFLGTASIFILYLLVKALFDREYREKERFKFSNIVALTAAFLLGISPWHIQFSRASFEANSGLFFVLLSAWLFIKGLDSSKYKIASFIGFAVSCYFYRSILVFVPLLLIVNLLIFHKELFAKKAKRISIVGIFVFLLLAAPIYFAVFVGNGAARAEQVSVASELTSKVDLSTQVIATSPGIPLGKIAMNRRLVEVEDVLHNYLTNFSFDFLFFNGDINGRQNIQFMGMLYLWEVLSLFVGIIALSRLPWKIWAFVGSWILLAPIPAALALPVPHALRDLNAVPMFALISAIGLVSLFVLLHNKLLRTGYMVIASIVILFFFVQFIYLYFMATPRLVASDWGYGYQQLVAEVTSQQKNYNKIVITGSQWEPYMYFLFFTHYDPLQYQKTGSQRDFAKYLFGGTSWDGDNYQVTLDRVNLIKYAGTNNALFVLSPKEYKKQKKSRAYKVVYQSTIYGMDGKPIFIFATVTKRRTKKS